MASTLPSAQTCCDPCTSPVTTAVPGPAGAAGAAGSNGTNGTNAYTTLSAQFTMPAELANVTVDVVTSAPFSVGQIIYIESGGAKGYFEIVTKPGATQLQIKNLEDTANNAYTVNSAPATVFANGGTVSPAGLQGPAGNAANAAPDNATYITQTPNGPLTNEQPLSALSTGIMFSTFGTGAVTTIGRGVADTNIAPVNDAGGLVNGEMLRATASGIESIDAATVRTTLGLVIGTNVQAYDATLQSLSALGTAGDRYAYTTGIDTWAEGTITAYARTILDDATASAARTTLGIARTLQDVLIYQHQLAAGTDAGDFTSGAWRTVPLNTEVTDTGALGSIAANTITLAAGTYRVRWHMCAYQVDRFQSRLFNVTTAAIIGLGSTSKAAAADTTMAESHGETRIIIAAATEDIRIEAQCETTNAGDGFGIANGFGGTQVYAGITLEKEVG